MSLQDYYFNGAWDEKGPMLTLSDDAAIEAHVDAEMQVFEQNSGAADQIPDRDDLQAVIEEVLEVRMHSDQ